MAVAVSARRLGGMLPLTWSDGAPEFDIVKFDIVKFDLVKFDLFKFDLCGAARCMIT